MVSSELSRHGRMLSHARLRIGNFLGRARERFARPSNQETPDILTEPTVKAEDGALAFPNIAKPETGIEEFLWRVVYDGETDHPFEPIARVIYHNRGTIPPDQVDIFQAEEASSLDLRNVLVSNPDGSVDCPPVKEYFAKRQGP